MDANLYLFYLLLGLGVSMAILIRLTLPDPPPWGLFVAVLVAGAIGAIAGGVIAHRMSSDPMPGFIGAIAGAIFLSGLVRQFTGGGAQRTA